MAGRKLKGSHAYMLLLPGSQDCPAMPLNHRNIHTVNFTMWQDLSGSNLPPPRFHLHLRDAYTGPARILFFRNCLPNRELTFPGLDFFFSYVEKCPQCPFPSPSEATFVHHASVCTQSCYRTHLCPYRCVWSAASSEGTLPFWEESGLKVKCVCGSENRCHESQPRLERREEAGRRTLQLSVKLLFLNLKSSTKKRRDKQYRSERSEKNAGTPACWRKVRASFGVLSQQRPKD